MASVAVHTFSEIDRPYIRSRYGIDDELARELLETETAAAEKRLGRTRVPYSDEYLGHGFKVGSGDDPTYAVIVIEQD